MKQLIPTWCDHTSAHAQRARHAFSLIEVLIVMSVAAFLFGIVLSLLSALMQWDRDMRAWSASDAEVARLVDVLRDDIRRATDVSSKAAGLIVVNLSEDQRVEYRFDDRLCRRQWIGASDVDQHEQVFSIGMPAAWELERTGAEKSPLVRIHLRRQPLREVDPAVPAVEVCAALGADRWSDRVPVEKVVPAAGESSDAAPDEPPSEGDES